MVISVPSRVFSIKGLHLLYDDGNLQAALYPLGIVNLLLDLILCTYYFLYVQTIFPQ